VMCVMHSIQSRILDGMLGHIQERSHSNAQSVWNYFRKMEFYRNTWCLVQERNPSNIVNVRNHLHNLLICRNTWLLIQERNNFNVLNERNHSLWQIFLRHMKTHMGKKPFKCAVC